MSSDPPDKDDNAWFITLPLKSISDQQCGRCANNFGRETTVENYPFSKL